MQAPPGGPAGTNSTLSWDLERALRRGALGTVIYVGCAEAGGTPTGERLRFVPDDLTIGRRPPPGVPAWTIDDRRISAEHARIGHQGSAFFLTDLGSRNGTLLDGKPVDGSVRLHDGAVLFLAGHAAVFRLLDEEDVAAISEDLADPFGPMPSASAPMAAALRRLRRVAGSGLPLLLTGETGTGKEVFARAVHGRSGRSGRLVAVNCAALPAELVESELFGYERGAHSQARERKRGIVDQAAGGTLFLDEIGDMPGAAQAKMLRFLETSEFLPLGATNPVRLDVRILAATSHIERDGTIPGVRPELAARLGASAIVLPPLRARPEDLGTLAFQFLGGDSGPKLTASAFLALCLHDWPKNVRELERVIKEAVVLAADADAVGLAHLPSVLTERLSVPASVKRRSPRPLPGREELEALLAEHEGNVARVARALDRQWAVVSRTLDRLGIDPERWKKP
jgi:transcriptional regulator with PAS, ATPase and Fis domain